MIQRFPGICSGPDIAHRRSHVDRPYGTSDLTRAIIGCAIRVHKVVGPGVYENIYSECLEYELREQGLRFELGRPAPLVYKGVRLRSKYYIDVVVENQVAVELKAVAALAEIHKRQVLTQLKLSRLPVGLLINFNVAVLTDGGVHRIVNPDLQQHHREFDAPHRSSGA